MEIQITGLKEISRRFDKFPDKLNRVMRQTMEAALYILQENVPRYPPKPATSTYNRTGTLGRSLGSGGGKADIFRVTGQGSFLGQGSGSYLTGEFGTRVKYAPYVIGDPPDSPSQAWMHKGRWWTMKTITKKSEAKITRAFQEMADDLARWLEGKGA